MIDFLYQCISKVHNEKVSIVVDNTQVTSTDGNKIRLNLQQLKNIYKTKQHRRKLPSVVLSLPFRNFILFVICHEIAHIQLEKLAIRFARSQNRMFEKSRVWENIIDGYALSLYKGLRHA